MGLIKRLRRAIKKRKADGSVARETAKYKKASELLHKLPDSSLNIWLEWYRDFVNTMRKSWPAKRYFPFSVVRLYEYSRLRAAWGKILADKNITREGKLHLNDVVLPAPASDHELYIYSVSIIDSLFPYLLDEYMPEGESISTYLYGDGPHEYGNVYIEKGDIVIDAGACLGEFAALASVRTHGGGAVYAFEPLPGNVERYLSKTAQYNDNIEVCQYALTDATGELIFGIRSIGSSSVYTGDGDKERITVKTISLDDFVKQKNLPRVDFIKADIEGAERNLLKGARNVLKEFAPKIAICTYHLPDDPEVLRGLILDANPNYVIEEKYLKMYAYVPKD